MDLAFQWSQPRSWGNVCSEPSNAGGFRLYVDGVNIKRFGVNSSSYVRKASSFGVGTHRWYIQAYRTGDSSANSATRTFTIVDPSVSVRGYLWNATGTSCTASPSPSREIPSVGVTVKVGSISGTVDQNPATHYTYNVNNVPKGNQVLTVGNLPEPPDPNSVYRLACVNGVETSSASFNAIANPTMVHLGYRVVSELGWTKALNGSVHANASLAFTRPAPSGQFHGQYLLSARDSINANVSSQAGWLASLYPQGDLTGNSPIPSPTYSQMLSLYGRGAAPSATIPAAARLVNGGIYRVTQSEVISGVYNVPSGVRALIFVNGTLTVNAEIRTPANSYLALIVRDNIRINKALAGGGPTEDSLQATFLAGGTINTAYNRTSSSEIHRQLVVEGNLISLQNTVFFYRNLGADGNSDTPAEIIQPRVSSFIRAKNILAKPHIFWREVPAGF